MQKKRMKFADLGLEISEKFIANISDSERKSIKLIFKWFMVNVLTENWKF